MAAKPRQDDGHVPYGPSLDTTGHGPDPLDQPRNLGAFGLGLTRAVAAHGVLYVAGLAAWGAENDLAWPVAVYWFCALVAGLLVGGAMLLSSGSQLMGGGVLVGTLLAAVVELAITTAVWSAWLSAHPGWQLS